ncbi:hypothetical protein A9Q99_17840 [Gammaproteobacteria bacterium 45_16_T64]|nr:hypothetical protein A9Q99_17840 [Gammaproteobacteria bacterium 45_16_T64]
MKIMSRAKKAFAGLAAGMVLASGAQAANLKPLTMCAFMMMGEGGPEHQMLLDYQAAALNWGVKLELKPYMNEKIVTEELKAGVCDVANMTGMQARSFNKFTGTLDSPGAIPTYDHLKVVLDTLAQPKAAKYMKEGDYEVVGIQSGGAIFLFTNDRKIQSMSDLAGKKMGVLESMPEMRQMVADMGMTPVSSTVTNIFQKFNNGVIDVTGGPAIVYDMMELYKGLEPNGGILAAPLVQSNLQFVGRAKNLPEGFGQKSREYFASNFEASMKFIESAEKNIPEKWWIPIPDGKEGELHAQTKRVRLAFRDAGVYDPKMLTLLRKIRCKQEPSRPECTAKNAE